MEPYLRILNIPLGFVCFLLHRNWFAVDNNLLSGSIPQMTNSTNDLIVFSISSNLLSGTIPSGMMVPRIQYLGLGNNDLVGTFPTNFETATSCGESIRALVNF